MTKEENTPFLRRGIFFLERVITLFFKIAVLLIGLTAIPVLCFVVFLWWMNDGQSKNKSAAPLILQDYAELRAISKSENARQDGKTLPLFETIETANFWNPRYYESTPKEFLEEKTLVASSKWGFHDRVSTGLFSLSQKSTEALITHLNTKFTKEEQDVETIQYTEKQLCLNHTDLDNHLYWSINSEKKKDFFKFCLQSRDVKKIKWGLTINWGENSGFSSINVTHYVGTTFFTVSHGSS